jgi:hypothetical protein
MKAYGGSRVTAPLILSLGTRWKVSSQLHAPVTLPPVPIEQKAGWASEPVWML